ncbi:MAG: bifunctional DNA-formamidopyrimidine glycosylase/DNA-(apurinic or apyrimidinic site) lyase [Microbacteriaceae bacterium]
MPELPEVEVVRAGLEPAVTGARIAGVQVYEARSLRRHVSASGSFAELLTGRTMLAAVRRGKFLWFPLAPAATGEAAGQALVVHLGMSGQVLLRAPGASPERQLRIQLQLEHPEHGELWMNFLDQRIFGSMAVDALIPTSDGLPGGVGSVSPTVPSPVTHIARDPLDPAFSDAAFLAALSHRRSAIKRVLLDQNTVSGIGNIYADEALWAARINAEQLAQSLSRRRAKSLLAEVRLVFGKALAEGGTSFDAQYVNVNGASGYFAHSLNAYGRAGQPCARCGTAIVRVSFMNRSSHFCPRCQRLRA